ncbi:MAG: DUF4126 domain-containing protein [Vulcanimicrobiaceae bacterium]
MDPRSFATLYALTTASGIRPFIVLALAALAMHFGYLHPSHPFQWLGSSGATAVLTGLAVLEFLADKVPYVDHALHAVHFTVAPVVAAILVGTFAQAGTGGGIDGGTALLMVLGALNALGVHGGVTAVRAVSTASTGGLGNPLVSIAEDVLAVAGMLGAFALPVVTALVALAFSLAAFWVVRRLWRTTRSPGPGPAR